MKNLFAKKMGEELLELCNDLDLDPACLGSGHECFDNRMRMRSLNHLVSMFSDKLEKNPSFQDYDEFFQAAKTILTARTKEEVQEQLQKVCNTHNSVSCDCMVEVFSNGTKVLRQGS